MAVGPTRCFLSLVFLFLRECVFLNAINKGHYVAIVKSGRRWVVFDDDMVEDIDERTLHTYFGANTEMASNLASGYILFYRSTSMPTSSSTSQPTRQPGGAAAARGTAVLDRDEEAEQRVNAKHDGVVAV